MLAAILSAGSLQGCLLLNSVRESTLPNGSAGAGKTRLVYGVDASDGAVAVALDRVDPGTGEGGNCMRHDHTEAVVPTGASGIKYFVFDAPPGNYVVAFFNSGGSFLGSDPKAFSVPPGQLTYIGDFSRFLGLDPTTSIFGSLNGRAPGTDLNGRPIYQLDREGLEAAKTALGPAADSLVLADTVPELNRAPACLCTP